MLLYIFDSNLKRVNIMSWHRVPRRAERSEPKELGSLDHPEAPRAVGKKIPPNPKGDKSVETLDVNLGSETNPHHEPRLPGSVALSNSVTIETDEE